MLVEKSPYDSKLFWSPTPIEVLSSQATEMIEYSNHLLLPTSSPGSENPQAQQGDYLCHQTWVTCYTGTKYCLVGSSAIVRHNTRQKTVALRP